MNTLTFVLLLSFDDFCAGVLAFNMKVMRYMVYHSCVLSLPGHATNATLDASRATHPCPSRSGHANQAQQMADLTQA